MSRRRMALALLVGSLWSLLVATLPARAEGPALVGAGSTWSQIALEQWRADVNRLGLQVNYQGVGSTTGRQFFAAGTVDFAVSEIPFQPEDPPVSRQYRYLPIVAGGTSMMYNITSASGEQIRDLRLSSETIAEIFTGQITTWSDDRIRQDYGKALPDLPIKVIVRSDGSGTSAQFSAYVAATQPTIWSAFTGACGVPATATSFWPYGQTNCLQNAIAQRGSDGIANYVANPGLGLGAIGYVEAGYAVARRFPVAAVRNASGAYTIPTAYNVATALKHATLNADSTQELSGVYGAPEKNAYPISSYSYMIVPVDGSLGDDKGAVLGAFIIYFACTGQQAAERLGYSPLPKVLVQYAFEAERAIPGAPEPPALTGSACPNPTLTGDFGPPPTGGGDGDTDEEPLPGTQDPDPGGGDPSSSPTPGAGDPTSVPTPGSEVTDPGAGAGDPSAGDPGGGDAGSGTHTDGNPQVAPGGTTVVTAGPATLSHAGLVAAKLVADEQIAGVHPGGVTGSAVAAFAVLLLVFGPLFLRFRAWRRS